jgi:hypothetical protein
MSLVFVDIETTGLDATRHEMIELAWAVEDGPISVVRPRHTLRFADPKALEVNQYYERDLGDVALWSTPLECSKFLLDARDNTLVAANPAFDASFLHAHFGFAPWHYRLFDVEAYAAGVFDWDAPRSLKSIRDELADRKHRMAVPDHSGHGDVVVLRQAYRALRRERRALHLMSGEQLQALRAGQAAAASPA